MTSEQSKLEILKKVEDGTLSVEEGAHLLGILDGEVSEQVGAEERVFAKHPSNTILDDQPEQKQISGCWKAAWSLVLWLGAGLTALSGYWMYSGYHRAGLGWGFWLSWIPLLIGLAITFLGILLMQGRWLNVKVISKKEGHSINLDIVLPLPLHFAAWVFRNFEHAMPEEVRNKHVGEMLEEIEQSMQRNEPFHVQVDDKEEGEYVEVTIV